MNTRSRRLIALTSGAALALGVMGSTTYSASAAVGSVITTKINDSTTGWNTSTETAGLGSVGYQADDAAPYGGYAALLKTGPGNPDTGKGGKPYLNQASLDATKLGDITDLAYSTKVVATPQPKLAPAFNLQLRADTGFKGTLVFEPIYNTDTAGNAPTTNTWQNWDLNSRNALWYSSRDVKDDQGNVVFAANTTHRYGSFLDAFAAAPTTYANMRVNDGRQGVNISLGQAGYNTDTSNIVAEVDAVTLGASAVPTKTYDFEPLPGCTTFDQASKTLTLTKDCSTTETLQMGDGWTFDGAGHTLTAVENSSSPNFPGAVVQSAAGTDTTPAALAVKALNIKTQFTGSNSGGGLAGIFFDNAGGSVTGTTIDKITHGNGAQEGQGIRVVDNQTTEASLALTDVTVTNYQKTGARILGNVNVTAKNLDIGLAGDNAGNPLTSIAANGVSLIDGARGTITGSKIKANRYSSDDSGTGNIAEATGLLLFDAGDVTVSGTDISGLDADAGVAIVDNGRHGTATINCSTITRGTGANTNSDPAVGIGVDNTDNPDNTVTLNSVTLTGWKQPTAGDVKIGNSADCNTTVSLSASPTAVVFGGSTTLSGTASDDNGPIVGGSVQLQRKQFGETEFTNVGNPATTGTDGSFTFNVVPAKNTSYRALLTAAGKNPSTSSEVKVAVRPKVVFRVSRTTAHSGQTVVASGNVSPAVANTKVTFQRKVGSTWSAIVSGVEKSDGSYQLSWKTSSLGKFPVRVVAAATPGFAAGISQERTVTVVK